MKIRTLYLGVLFFLMADSLTGCATPRKISSNTKETTKVEEKRTENAVGEFTALVDTTKKEGLEINYTKIEFYPLGESNAPEVIIPECEKLDSTKHKQPPNKRGGIKSIEKYTIKQNTEAAGIAKTEERTQVATKEEIVTDISADEEVTEAPAPDPYRWRYILAILIIVLVAGTAAYFWLRKTKVVTIIVSFFKKLFF